jgi:hypothetical protein
MSDRTHPDPSSAGAKRMGERGPCSAEEALASAASHARAALAETLAALRALLDAAALATSGEPAEARRVLGPLARTLEGLAADLDGAGRDRSSSILVAIAEALDAEIERWELRAREDADARAVLRAFLGLRELLWEFGVRRPESSAPRRPGDPGSRPAAARRARPRVQRVRVEG